MATFASAISLEAKLEEGNETSSRMVKVSFEELAYDDVASQLCNAPLTSFREAAKSPGNEISIVIEHIFEDGRYFSSPPSLAVLPYLHLSVIRRCLR